MQRSGQLLLDAVTGCAIDMLNASGSGHSNFLRSNSCPTHRTAEFARRCWQGHTPAVKPYANALSQKVSEVMLQSS
jgi:hypothetical protein